MPNWSGGILTTKGQALQAKVDAGQTKLIVTKMKVGSGVLPNGQNLQSLNDLVAPEMNVPLSGVSANANISTIVGVITNAGLTNGFNVRELGVYAQDPTLGEILYAITTDSAPDYLPPEGGAVTVSSEFSYNIVVSNAANVTATIDQNGLVTVSILQLHKNAAVLDHPDGSVTDAKIGNRSITDTMALAGTSGTLTALLGRIGNMIKSITGKANWYTVPAITLEQLGRNFWKASTAYSVGDTCYSATSESYKRFECTVAGISGVTEPTWGAIGTTITDGTITWKVYDVRQGNAIGKTPTLVDAGSGVVGLPAVSGSLLTGVTKPSDIAGLVALTNFTGTNQNLTANGWQKLPGGLILQWVTTAALNAASNTSLAITLPLTFPTQQLASFPTWYNANGLAGLLPLSSTATSNSVVTINYTTGGATSNVKVFVLGC